MLEDTIGFRTTVAPGVPPQVHGITSNRVSDPEGLSNEAWHWYASEIREPSLFTQELRPNVLLARAGLLTEGPDGSVVDWRAFFHADGGNTALHLRKTDPALRERIEAVLMLEARPGFAVGKPDPGCPGGATSASSR